MRVLKTLIKNMTFADIEFIDCNKTRPNIQRKLSLWYTFHFMIGKATFRIQWISGL